MTVTHEHLHVVQQGESLAHIAEQYRLSSWRAIYNASGNDALRRKRPNPQMVQEGDIVNIPPNAGELAKGLLNALHRLKQAVIQHFDRHQRVLEDTLLDPRDAAPTSEEVVEAMIVELRGITRRAPRELDSIRAEITASNRALARTHVRRAEPAPGVMSGAASNDGLVWAATKELLDFWEHMWASQQWVRGLTGIHAERAYQHAWTHLNTTRSKLTQQIDQRMRGTQNLIDDLMAEGRAAVDA